MKLFYALFFFIGLNSSAYDFVQIEKGHGSHTLTVFGNDENPVAQGLSFELLHIMKSSAAKQAFHQEQGRHQQRYTGTHIAAEVTSKDNRQTKEIVFNLRLDEHSQISTHTREVQFSGQAALELMSYLKTSGIGAPHSTPSGVSIRTKHILCSKNFEAEQVTCTFRS